MIFTDPAIVHEALLLTVPQRNEFCEELVGPTTTTTTTTSTTTTTAPTTTTTTGGAGPVQPEEEEEVGEAGPAEAVEGAAPFTG